MPWWETAADSLGIIVGLLAAAVGFLFVRRRWIGRTGSTFECSVRTRVPSAGVGTTARGWTLGVGRHTGDSLEWFRIFSFSARPKHVFSRAMVVLGRRTPHGPEAFALYAGHRVIEVRLADGRHVELAMADSAGTGFLAWIEAAPPGDEHLLLRGGPE